MKRRVHITFKDYKTALITTPFKQKKIDLSKLGGYDRKVDLVTLEKPKSPSACKFYMIVYAGKGEVGNPFSIRVYYPKNVNRLDWDDIKFTGGTEKTYSVCVEE